jgi:autotransporter-associated beta strand protein
VLSGPGVVAKSTNSTLVLNGVNTYTGGTTMNGGTLFLPTSGTWAAGRSPLTGVP